MMYLQRLTYADTDWTCLLGGGDWGLRTTHLCLATNTSFYIQKYHRVIYN